MSKAFTREGDDLLEDVLAVDDLALPPGVPNYLTPAGAERLRADIARLRRSPRGDVRRKVAVEQRLQALVRRLEAAVVIDPREQPHDRVLFGATAVVRDEDGEERRYRIVGIDEADPRRRRVSWRSPVARALLDRRVGDVATLRAPGGDEELEVVAIEYPSDPESTTAPSIGRPDGEARPTTAGGGDRRGAPTGDRPPRP